MIKKIVIVILFILLSFGIYLFGFVNGADFDRVDCNPVIEWKTLNVPVIFNHTEYIKSHNLTCYVNMSYNIT